MSCSEILSEEITDEEYEEFINNIKFGFDKMPEKTDSELRSSNPDKADKSVK